MFRFFGLDVWQQSRDDTKKWQESAQLKDEFDACKVSKPSEKY